MDSNFKNWGSISHTSVPSLGIVRWSDSRLISICSCSGRGGNECGLGQQLFCNKDKLSFIIMDLRVLLKSHVHVLPKISKFNKVTSTKPKPKTLDKVNKYRHQDSNNWFILAWQHKQRARSLIILDSLNLTSIGSTSIFKSSFSTAVRSCSTSWKSN